MSDKLNNVANQEFSLEDAVDFLIHKGNAAVEGRVMPFGQARLPIASAEREHCEAILGMFGDYVQRSAPSRPLSIAVFGPPGSGKSFTVKQLAKQSKGFGDAKTINLSQLANPTELTKWLQEISVKSAESTAVPLLFFDEFDSSLEKEELGWLRWFLAPMWDGEFVHDGKTVELKKAVFVFAGGTAHRYEEFEERHAQYFRSRKGPDFASRLCGFLNIEGLNTYGPGRYLRRALILQHQLVQRAENLRGKDGTLKIESETLKLLLAGGHYIHDARSLQALMDMLTLPKADEFRRENLPSVRLMNLHVNRGPLDRMAIGISSGEESASTEFFSKFAKELIQRGAVLAFGGNLSVGCTLQSLIDVVKQFPEDLIPRDEKRIRNFLAYPSFLKPDARAARTDEILSRVDFDELHTLSPEELQDVAHSNDFFSAFSDEGPYIVENHLAWSLSLFRMRMCLIQEIRALVVIGGKVGQPQDTRKPIEKRTLTMPWGRFPGIAEEVMLALAFKVPVYVLGMSGGAAHEIGNLMGLSRIQTHSRRLLQTPSGRDYEKFSQRLASNASSFEIPHIPDLPKTFDELREYFRKQGPGKEGWESNGLTAKENRELFNLNSEQIDRSVELIIRGVTRLNSLPPSSAADTPASQMPRTPAKPLDS